MENKINIAEILRDMPNGTKLYSPLLGEVKFEEVVSDDTFPIKVLSKVPNSPIGSFTENGFYYGGIEDAEAMLLPSREMRDWSKLFKRGDVLVDGDLETAVVFDGWANDDYTKFNTTIDYYKISDSWGKEDICCTLLFRKATNEERAEFIAAAERHYVGKYDPKTLKVRPAKRVFKPKCSFEPFQKVLVRNDCENTWCANYFSHYLNNTDYHYACIDTAYRYCVAYEGNEYLLGTNNKPE
nr:MAG TPA: hypothetical protein [Caudoviricetes sp.]